MIKKTLVGLLALVLSFGIATCSGGRETNIASESDISSNEEISSGELSDETSENKTMETTGRSLVFKANDAVLNVFLADSQSVDALKELAENGLTIQMRPYGEFGQIGSIGKTIASSDEKLATSPGDICLYQSDKLALFFGSDTREYTKLGHVVMGRFELIDLLGDEDIMVIISLK